MCRQQCSEWFLRPGLQADDVSLLKPAVHDPGSHLGFDVETDAAHYESPIQFVGASLQGSSLVAALQVSAHIEAGEIVDPKQPILDDVYHLVKDQLWGQRFVKNDYVIESDG